MTSEERTDAAALSELYAEYKRLALSYAAGLIFAGDLDELRRRTRELRELAPDGPGGGRLQPAFQACALALGELEAAMAARPEATATGARAAVETVRARHRALQSQIWQVLPFEYQPCAAGDRRGCASPQEEEG